VTRARLPALGYAYVALALPAVLLGRDHGRATSALLTGAAFAYLWFLASLRAQLVLGGAAYLALETLAILAASTQAAAPASACAATVIIGSSLAAWRARKIPKWFGQAGITGGVAVLAVGLVEGAADWTLAGDAVYASSLGFMVWVVVTATYLLRR